MGVERLTPTYTAELFPALHAELLALLRRLEAGDWARPTLATRWRVRDVVAHLLDGDVRRLSADRDGHRMSARTLSSYGDVVDLINGLNASGVSYAERLSPRVMIDLLEVTGRWVSEHFATLEPHARACFAVAWAGEDQSENWMDIGREYTERWHHQMQIRHAVAAEGLLQRRWFYPLLEFSVRAFPRAYQEVPATVGTAVVFEVDADGEHAWSIIREASAWRVVRGRAPEAAARVRVDADAAWKLLYNALSAEAAGARVAITGERSLAEPILRARAVMV